MYIIIMASFNIELGLISVCPKVPNAFKFKKTVKIVRVPSKNCLGDVHIFRCNSVRFCIQIALDWLDTYSIHDTSVEDV